MLRSKYNSAWGRFCAFFNAYNSLVYSLFPIIRKGGLVKEHLFLILGSFTSRITQEGNFSQFLTESIISIIIDILNNLRFI
jgi:hypothetical protein